MGNSRSSLQLQPEDIVTIQEETGFNQRQIERLYSRFLGLDRQGKGYLCREDFLRIPELAINPLGDRIVHAFFHESKLGANDRVDFRDFLRVLAHFRPIKKKESPGINSTLNSRLEKLHFAFSMYDLDGDNYISKEELLAVLTMMVGANISTEQLVSIAERTVLEADFDKDKLISFEEFVNVLEKTDVEHKMSIRFLN